MSPSSSHNNISKNVGRTVYRVLNQDFIVETGFRPKKLIGNGSYGVVCSAEYFNPSGIATVAIKKVPKVFASTLMTKRVLREIVLLSHLRGHPNIVSLYDLDLVYSPNGQVNGLYIYEELMDSDLDQIIKSGQQLTDAHCQNFVYQILCGLKYIHSAGVLHRDLKPNNILVNADCHLKISDFGLSRGYSDDWTENNHFLTEFVAARWYRAPELMLNYHGYTKAIDIWSVGCIFAELLGRVPLFQGNDYVNQLNRILQVLGTPSEQTLNQIRSRNVRAYIQQLGTTRGLPFNTLFPSATDSAINLLTQMLRYSPETRITVQQALNHSYLQIWHDPNDEPICMEKVSFEFEKYNHTETLKQLVEERVNEFRYIVRYILNDSVNEKNIKLESSI